VGYSDTTGGLAGAPGLVVIAVTVAGTVPNPFGDIWSQPAGFFEIKAFPLRDMREGLQK
jgi:hypothetical protein